MKPRLIRLNYAAPDEDRPAGGVSPLVQALLGITICFALVLAGAVVGSALVLGLARRWGRPLAIRPVGQATFERYAGLSAAGGGWWLFVATWLDPAAVNSSRPGRAGIVTKVTAAPASTRHDDG